MVGGCGGYVVSGGRGYVVAGLTENKTKPSSWGLAELGNTYSSPAYFCWGLAERGNNLSRSKSCKIDINI